MHSRTDGRWLVVWRIVCASLAVLCLAWLLIELPGRYAEMVTLARSVTHVGDILPGFGSALATAAVLPLYADAAFALEVLAALGFFVVAALIFLRRLRDPVALFVSLMLVAFGAALPGTAYALLHSLPIWRAPAGPVQALGWFLLLPFAYLFPTGRFAPRWTWLLVPLWALWVLSFFLLADVLEERSNLFVPLSFVVWVIWLGSGVLAQLYRYRYVSTPVQRQQTKWVVFGFVLAVIGSGVATVPHIILLSQRQSESLDIFYRLIAVSVMSLAGLLIPLTIGIAILRYQLFDIDKLINRTLVYGSLTALHVLIYLTSVFVLESVLRAITGQTSSVAVVAATLITVALFRPLRRRIQRAIDRRFYRRKYNAARVLDDFSASLCQEVDLVQLRAHLVTVVAKTMEPAHISLWLNHPTPSKTTME
ncbi:MAG: hypothetical protein ACXWP6_18245 [Ktedonobacterales bacterium]